MERIDRLENQIEALQAQRRRRNSKGDEKDIGAINAQSLKDREILEYIGEKENE